jgi:hypothetical protein
MDIFDTLEVLEQQVRESPWIPLTQLRAVDVEQVLRLLREVRAELDHAQREPLTDEVREDVLSQAAYEGKLIIEAARQESEELLSGDRISSQRQQYFDEIVGEGRQRANQHMRLAYGYTTERMTEVERSLRALREQVGEGRTVAQKTTKDAEKHLRQSKKEVSREKARTRRQRIKQALF